MTISVIAPLRRTAPVIYVEHRESVWFLLLFNLQAEEGGEIIKLELIEDQIFYSLFIF